MAQIDLGALQHELAGFQGKLDRWAQGAVSSTERARDAHLAKIRQLQGGREGTG